jgi:CBS domain-containing protein
MICPYCGHDNLPGDEVCSHCHGDLTQLDRPVAHNRIQRSLMEDPVSVLGLRMPSTVLPTATVGETVRLMLTRDIGALLVVDEGGNLVGIFSERDLLTKVAGVYQDFNHLPVSQFMTPKPETVSHRDTLAFALHKMDVGGYRHLPVIKDGRPVSVVSVRDMLRHLTQLS